jgi:hypothetical protein
MPSIEDEKFPPIINCSGQTLGSPVTGLLTDSELGRVKKTPVNGGTNNLFALKKLQTCTTSPGQNMVGLSYFQSKSDIEELASETGFIGAYCDNDGCPNKLY